MAEPKSPLERLREKPHRFRFDAAYRLLLNFGVPLAADDDAVRFVATATTSQPNSEVTEAAPAKARKPARLTTPLIGLIGPSTVMPRWYTELIAQSGRNKSGGIVDFFDLLAQRLIVAFARAGIKYRLHRSAETSGNKADAVEPIGAGLLALTGYGTAHMTDRLAAGPDILRHYAGFFASRPRSADRLAAMVSHYLSRPATIVEFAGSWLTLPPDQQSRLPRGRVPGAFNRLGQDAAIGTRAYDQQARFIVRIGPLNHEEFNNLLPDRRSR
jgi:type VI secretion system protein ImpH